MKVTSLLTIIRHRYANSSPLMLSTLISSFNMRWNHSLLSPILKTKHTKTKSYHFFDIPLHKKKEHGVCVCGGGARGIYLIQCIRVDCYRFWISAWCLRLYPPAVWVMQNRLGGNHVYLLRYWSTLCQHSPLRRGSECWQAILPLQRASSSQRIVHGCPHTLKEQIKLIAILAYVPGSEHRICRAGEMRRKSQVLC